MKILNLISVILFVINGSVCSVPQPIAIGSRLELFVDVYLIDELSGGARMVLQHPVLQEVAIVHDEPWEGSATLYHSVFKDNDRYRIYYSAGQITIADGTLSVPHQDFACYAESDDGIHWRKPALGLVEFNGSKQNNILLATGKNVRDAVDPTHIAVFKDTNPDVTPDAIYKAILGSVGYKGLYGYKSSDGIHWSPIREEVVIVREDIQLDGSIGYFDSQNLAFWDSAHGIYRAYFRFWPDNRRDIMTVSSKDFLTWVDPVPLKYPGARPEQLYTSQVKPYYRAPHILIGFPTRYNDRGWSDSTRALPEYPHRRERAGPDIDVDGDGLDPRFGTAVTEALFMTSRDGQTFNRWNESFLRPGIERKHTWAYGNNYIAWHPVETKSRFEDAPNELSLYASEGYWTGTSSHLRRYTLRVDGFVSINAPLSGGELITKPITFAGDEMVINFSSSAAGGIQVEIQDTSGKPIEDFALSDCSPVFGDSLERMVNWTNNSDLSTLSGQPVRLRFLIKDADLFSFRFRKTE